MVTEWFNKQDYKVLRIRIMNNIKILKLIEIFEEY